MNACWVFGGRNERDAYLNKVRFGLIGGGFGALIGRVHKMAAELSGSAELVCGVFSRDPNQSKKAGVELFGIDPHRSYPDVETMCLTESAVDESRRAEVMIVATPNHSHFEIAKHCLNSGFHVVCDKPMTVSVNQAQELAELVEETGLSFGLTYNYTGYPMVRHARRMVLDGQLGEIRRVSCEYLQGWLAKDLSENKQAVWRTDPELAGPSGCFGDIGSHAENLVSYVSSLEMKEVCADLTRFVPGRRLDDDGTVLIRFRGGAKGYISASQIAVGRENDISLEIYGTQGSIEWKHSDPNSLLFRSNGEPLKIYRSGGPGEESASRDHGLPAGHPEGFIEAFSEIYRNFFENIREGAQPMFPSVLDGVRGMHFLETVVASSEEGSVWKSLEGGVS